MADFTYHGSTRVVRFSRLISVLFAFSACGEASDSMPGATPDSAGTQSTQTAATPSTAAMTMGAMAAAGAGSPAAQSAAASGAAQQTGAASPAMAMAMSSATTPASATGSMAANTGVGVPGASAGDVNAPPATDTVANGAAGAPAMTMTMTTPMGMGADAAEGPTDEHEDLGMGDGSDVVTVGDSWMSYAANGGGIETGLLAASGQRYRTYGVAGTMLLDEVIPNQYETAKRQNPDIKTVVMTGGGNDLLLTGMTVAGCGDGCMSTIDRVTDRLKEMWDEMAMDGVQDVIYVEYSRGGTNEPGVTYANEVIPPVCAAAPVRCHFIDSDLIIDKVLLDGVHPTADGCRKLGQAIFDLMVEKGMRR